MKVRTNKVKLWERTYMTNSKKRSEEENGEVITYKLSEEELSKYKNIPNKKEDKEYEEYINQKLNNIKK